MFAANVVCGQIFGKNTLEEVNVSPPHFTGIENHIYSSDKANIAIFNQYMAGVIVYPKIAVDKNLEGTEVIQFVVNTNGELTDFNIINSISEYIDDAVIKALQSTNGMWKPGTNNNEAVAMEKEISVTFILGAGQEINAKNDFVKIARILFCKGNKEFLKKGKPKSALRIYNAALSYLPYDQNLLLMRGFCHFELGNIEQAREDWSRIKALDGIDESIYQLVNIQI